MATHKSNHTVMKSTFKTSTMERIVDDVLFDINSIQEECFLLALQPELSGWDKAIVFVIPRRDLSEEIRDLIVAWIKKLRLHEIQRFLPKLNRFYAVVSGTEEEIDDIIGNPMSVDDLDLRTILLRLEEMKQMTV